MHEIPNFPFPDLYQPAPSQAPAETSETASNHSKLTEKAAQAADD